MEIGGWLQTSIDMDVGMYGWCRDQEPCKRHVYGQCMVGADTHRDGLWAFMVGVEIKRDAC